MHRTSFPEACETGRRASSPYNRLVAFALQDLDANTSGPPLSLTFMDHWLHLFSPYEEAAQLESEVRLPN